MLHWDKSSLRSFDWVLFISALFLIALGLAAIYSVDLSRGGELVYFRKQVIALGIGLVFFAAASLSQRAFFASGARLAYWLSAGLLVSVLFLGQTIRGTTGWFAWGGFSFQPVEAAKIGLILMLAYVVASFGRKFERPGFFFGTGALTFFLMGLVMLQPDLGSAVLLGMIWFGIMLMVGVRTRYIAGLVVLGLAVAVFAWFFLLKDYQKNRLTTFIYPNRDALGSGYNVTQSTIAVGSGQWLGRGLGFGSQSQLRFLPEAQTDFVFSVIAEELGFAGAAVLVVLFAIMIWRLTLIIKSAPDDFAAVAVGGIATLFFSQFFINIGANVGMLPVTGVTLPFVSYGGSSLIINLFLLGIAQSMVERKY